MTFADTVFFCNSGAEACEGAIKVGAALSLRRTGSPNAGGIITFKGAFHGRTLATIAPAGNAKYLEGFGEPADGFDHRAVRRSRSRGAGHRPRNGRHHGRAGAGRGRRAASPNAEFLKALRELCDKHGLLLVLDEVQCGMGRTGKLFAHEWAGITPDVMAVAKGIGGGFPLGAFLATKEAAKGMVAGTHGSTFGGNPLAMAVGNAVLDAVLEPGFLEHVQAMSLRLKQAAGARSRTNTPTSSRRCAAAACLTGIKVKPPYGDVVDACADEKLLTVGAGDNVVRLLPPLNVTEAGDRRRLRTRLARGAGAPRPSPPEACQLREAQRHGAPRHFLDIDRIDAGTLRRILDMAHAMKKAGKRVPAKLRPDGIADAVLMLIFEKPSTRTRVSFDVAMRQLGGQTIALNHTDLQIGRGEPISDTAKVLSRYVDAIMIRANKHETLTELAEHATVPVINGLTDRTHPCQIVADIMTFEEAQGADQGPQDGLDRRRQQRRRLLDPGRRTARFQAGARLPAAAQSGSVRSSTGPSAQGADIELTDDPDEAVAGADCVVTDTWVSMGQQSERAGASSCWRPMRSTTR